MNILVYLESRDGRVRPAGLEALTAGRKVADAGGGELTALLIGDGVSSLVSEVGKYGAKRILTAEAAELNGYSPEGYREALLAAAAQCEAKVVMLSATALGRDLAPLAAARLDAAFLPDCTSLEYDEGRLVVSRPVYGGRCIMTFAATGWPVVLTLRPKAFLTSTRDGVEPEVVPLEVDLSGKIKTRLVETTSESGGRLDVTEADVVVSGGRGMKEPGNFRLVEDLAEALKGAVGASRPVVDAGWRPHGEQVGQTGKVVSPTLYIACGISGAIQHLAGMRSSKVIVAVNKDPEAPIFKTADYGIVGNCMEVLPELIKAVKAV